MATSIPLLETLAITLSSTGVAELAFNRPNRFNAMSALAYNDWLVAIKWAARCDAVKVTVLTGRGKYYTSGQELQAPDLSPEGIERLKKRRACVKIGPAIGFGVTTLALCDVVYSVPEATFVTPFMKLSFCAEGCSSYLFPKIMGVSKANEMLLMGRTFSAQELEATGFVSRLIPAERFHKDVLDLAEASANYTSEAIQTTKRLIRDTDREVLLKVNAKEMKTLDECSSTQASIDSLNRFVREAKQKKEAKLAKKSRL
ncbi:ClpP/crotonase-like domain-containing protein [Thamnidium elegans]|nr:ClpP/crotonase-like domain-containing protein [Thamnidium elegans]